ncbi:MAG: anthranilate phosphoribosyltransferase [Phycisphaerales bacterium]|nr:anthranilate phosphoribosyltransferase [Phycisphaerales bacterium]MCI0630582.1 anthranilate phosphoribosyltransferase [Phycisphaerales bacterium]MCI0676044.1 anthranilate phosphoribosyltransferase [Phycisphaerales bacterium]
MAENSFQGASTSSGPAEFARPARPGDLTPVLQLLLAGQTLSADQIGSAFEAMMSGQCHHGEIGALLGLMATRTPTTAEIVGAARVMRRHVDRVESNCDPADIVDTAGTGGAAKTFNVSTAAAIIAAAVIGPKMRVAKHGNRSRTGRGSAEVLKALGVNVDADRATQKRCLDEAAVCFCFAIHHHPATKHVMPVRQALGFPTIFNLLGPLTNPAGARRQVMGVYHPRVLQPIAEALRDLGAIRAMVVHSNDGLDEFSISASTNVFHVHDGKITEEVVSPKQLGLTMAPREAVVAQDLEHAARMIRQVIDGTEKGAPRDMSVLNAAAAIVVADKAQSIQEGVELAARAIDTGAAEETLRRLVRHSRP